MLDSCCCSISLMASRRSSHCNVLFGCVVLLYSGIGDNQLRSTIPSELCHLTDLQLLYVDRRSCVLSGVRDADAREVASFSIAGQQALSGTIPACFSNLTQLATLYVARSSPPSRALGFVLALALAHRVCPRPEA